MRVVQVLLLLSFLQTTIVVGQTDISRCVTSLNYEDEKNLFTNPALFDQCIADKRIILLGELDHGDGTSFEMKTKLISYLHEQHGFNTLVFEAGFIDCDQYWDGVTRGKDASQTAKEYIYYIWSQVEENRALFDYIDRQKHTENPLVIRGMDPQFSGSLQEETFLRLLSKKLDAADSIQIELNAVSAELAAISEWLVYPENHHIDEATFYSYLDEIKSTVFTKLQTDETSRWNKYFENIETFAKIKWGKREGSFALRDRQMFDNLKYWLDQHDQEKIIVWAANAHIIRNDKWLEGRDSNETIVGIEKLGDHIFTHYPNEAYSIAFGARSGKTLNFYNKKEKKLSRVKPSGLEEKLKQFDFAFAPLACVEDYFTLSKYDSHLIYANVRCTGKWSEHYDAVLFINDMKASTPLW